jgi:N6-adenosine-specific RNA methylase IME4
MQLTHFDVARRELALAVSIDEVKQLRDKAEAIRQYIRQQGASLEMQNQAAEIKIRAERRIGEMLGEQELHAGGRPQNRLHDVTGIELPPKLCDLGITKMQSHRWQLSASVPEEVLEQHITEIKNKGKELTSASVHQLALSHKRLEIKLQTGTVEPPQGKYRVIYADPPWNYDDKREPRLGGAEYHYPCMSIADLCALPVKDIAEDNAVLFLWVTSPLLEESFEIVRSWGFEYKTSFVWDKVNHNMGHYNSIRHEFLLVCTRGSCLPDTKKLFDSVVSIEKTRKHSEKPERFREIIDILYPHGNRIELFGREPVQDWKVWGNEAQ